MRKLFVLAIVAGLMSVGGYVRDASATATVDLVFVEKNGGGIAPTNIIVGAVAGDTYLMQIRMRNDVALTAAVFSLQYDLPADNALDVLGTAQWGGLQIAAKVSDFFQPLGPLDPVGPHFLGSYQGATTNLSLPRTLPAAAGAFAGGYVMGTVLWKVTGNGPDTNIITGVLNAGIDAFGDAGFNNISASILFHGGSVSTNVIPEPGTAALLGLGLVGLVLTGRRNRA